MESVDRARHLIAGINRLVGEWTQTPQSLNDLIFQRKIELLRKVVIKEVEKIIDDLSTKRKLQMEASRISTSIQDSRFDVRGVTQDDIINFKLGRVDLISGVWGIISINPPGFTTLWVANFDEFSSVAGKLCDSISQGDLDSDLTQGGKGLIHNMMLLNSKSKNTDSSSQS
jgi:hypothetical protein